MVRALVLLLFSFAASASTVLVLPIVDVYDGDTIYTQLSLPGELSRVGVRVYGIDTPERPAKSYRKTGKLGRAKCDKEALDALRAQAMVQDLARKSDVMRVAVRGWGKYGGRLVGDVEIAGVDVATMLINAGLATRYYGKGQKRDWCQ